MIISLEILIIIYILKFYLLTFSYPCRHDRYMTQMLFQGNINEMMSTYLIFKAVFLKYSGKQFKCVKGIMEP